MHERTLKFYPPIDLQKDHVIGNPDAEMMLVEFGRYTSASRHAAHEVIGDPRDRFGDRLRYAYFNSGRIPWDIDPLKRPSLDGENNKS